MKKEKTLSKEEFKKSWLREAAKQPGMILDVLSLNGVQLKTKTPPLTSRKAS